MKKYSEDFLKYGEIGTYNVENTFSRLKVFAVDRHDYKIQFMWFYDGKPDSRMTTATIRHTGAGRPYFVTRGRRVHMDEVARDELGDWNL